MHPTSDESIRHAASRRPCRAAFAAVSALLFATVATIGTVVSLGAYCLTTDGGDSRALAAIRQLASRSAERSREGPAPDSGASCPLPPRHPEVDPMPVATPPVPLPAATLARSPAVDRDRATAVFALG